MTEYAFCPATGLACSTAALTHGCRCKVCGPWYAQHLEQRREGRPAKVVHVASPQCPEHRCAASTAYRKMRCRCSICRAWNAARERRRRAFAEADATWKKFMAEAEEDPMTMIEFMAWVVKEAKKIG